MKSNYGTLDNVKNLIKELNNQFKVIEEKFLKYETEQIKNFYKLIDLKPLSSDELVLENRESTVKYIFESMSFYSENKIKHLLFKNLIHELSEYNDVAVDKKLISTLDKFQEEIGKISDITYTLPKIYASKPPLIQHAFLSSFNNNIEMKYLFKEINSEVIKYVDIIKKDYNPQEQVQISSLIKANQSSAFLPQSPPQTIEEQAKAYRKVLEPQNLAPVIEGFREGTQETLLSNHMAALKPVESHSLDNNLSADFTIHGCQIFIPHQYRM